MRVRSVRLAAVPSGRRDESGFTLVEVVVSLTILAVGIVGVIGVTNGSLKVASAGSRRSKAVAIATREIERFRAIPYAQLPKYQTTPTTDTSKPWSQTGSKQIGGARFDFTKTLFLDPSFGYHLATIEVRWQDESGAHVLAQTSRIYPGGIGPNGATATTTNNSNCTPPAPSSLTATVPIGSIGETSIDLAWNVSPTACKIESFVIQYSRDSFNTVAEVTRSAFDSTFRVTGLSAGTTFQFRVGSVSAAGQLSNWTTPVTIATAASTTAPCEVGIVTVTPAFVNKKANNQGSGLKEKVTVEVPSKGTCTGFKARYKPTGTTAIDKVLTAVGSQWSGELAWRDPQAWDVGKHYVEVYDTSVSPNKLVATVLLTVCEHNTACR